MDDLNVGLYRAIANLLDEWGLIKLVNVKQTADPVVTLSQIKVLPYKEKNEWNLITKYTIGKKG